MKILLLIFPILLFAFTTNAEPVLDVDGEPLRWGVEYYALPFIWGPGGGGLSFGKTGDQTCPVSVLQSPLEVNRGKPIVFKPSLETPVIDTDTALEIAFPDPPSCAESGNWLIVNDFEGEYWSVGIGGPQDHEGHQTLTGYFKIHKYGSYAYRFSFLPFVRAPMSGYIGRARNNEGQVRLVVENKEDLYAVIFQKASSEVSKI